MKKKLLVVVAALALALCLPATAFASNSAFDKGTADSTSYVDAYTGNAFLTERDALNLAVECDLYWAGETLNASGLDVGSGTGGSALLAGNTLNVASSSVQGSLRAAGQTINISSTSVGNNITVAGADIAISSDVSARGVYAAGSEVSVSGTNQGAAFAAGTVNLAGTYAGDVSVSAGTVNVSKATTVGGTLRVPSNANVVIEDGANVPNVSYADDPLVSSDSEGQISPLATVGPLLFSCIAHALLVLLFVFGMLMVDAEGRRLSFNDNAPPAEMLYQAAFFALPLIALLLLFPLVTAPISVLIVICIVVLWMFSIPVAGYVLGRRLFKNMKAAGAGVLGALILTAVCYVPYLFFVVPTISSIFVAGYAIQHFLDNRAQQKSHKAQLPAEGENR